MTENTIIDEIEAAAAIRLIRQQEKALGRRLPFAVLFTRTSAAIRPRTLQHIRDEFAGHGVPTFGTQMHEQEAFRAIFSFGGTVNGLSPAQVSNLQSAAANAQAFAGEVVTLLRWAEERVEGAAA